MNQLGENQAFAFFKNLDIFGKGVPSWNIGGRSVYKTNVGAASSLAILFVILSFGLVKL